MYTVYENINYLKISLSSTNGGGGGDAGGASAPSNVFMCQKS